MLLLWEQISTGVSWFPSSDFSLLYQTLNKLPILQAQAFDPTYLFFGTSELFQHHCPSHVYWDILGTDKQTSYLIQRLSRSLMYEKEIILNFLSRLNHALSNEPYTWQNSPNPVCINARQDSVNSWVAPASMHLLEFRIKQTQTTAEDWGTSERHTNFLQRK